MKHCLCKSLTCVLASALFTLSAYADENPCGRPAVGIPDAFTTASLIFTGRVDKARISNQMFGGVMMTIWTVKFRVQQVHRGPLRRGQIKTIKLNMGPVSKYDRFLIVGKEWLVAAYRVPGTRVKGHTFPAHYQADFCRRTKPLQFAAEDLAELKDHQEVRAARP